LKVARDDASGFSPPKEELRMPAKLRELAAFAVKNEFGGTRKRAVVPRVAVTESGSNR